MRRKYPEGSTWQVLCLAYDLSIPWVERARSSEIVALGTGRSLSLLHVSYVSVSPYLPFPWPPWYSFQNLPFGASIIRSFVLPFRSECLVLLRVVFGTRFTQRRTWCNQKRQVEASFGSAFRNLTPQKPCRYPQGFHLGIPPPLLAQLLKRCFMFVSNWCSFLP